MKFLRIQAVLSAVLSACLLAPLPAFSQQQTVWRCGTDGKTYSNRPCPEGRALEAMEPRPGADVAAAQDAARREKAQAARLARERELQEARAPKGAAGIRSAKAAEEPVKPKVKVRSKNRKGQQPPEDDDIFRATVPSSRQTKG